MLNFYVHARQDTCEQKRIYYGWWVLILLFEDTVYGLTVRALP